MCRWERLLTLEMQPAQELRGMQGADWWSLELQLPEVSIFASLHALAITSLVILCTGLSEGNQADPLGQATAQDDERADCFHYCCRQVLHTTPLVRLTLQMYVALSASNKKLHGCHFGQLIPTIFNAQKYWFLRWLADDRFRRMEIYI